MLVVQSDRQMLPMHKIGADRVPPAHVSPLVAVRIVLIKQVVFAVKIHKSVRVVHPVHFWGEMKLWAIGLFIIVFRLTIIGKPHGLIGFAVGCCNFVNVDVPPSAGRIIKNSQRRFLALQVFHVPKLNFQSLVVGAGFDAYAFSLNEQFHSDFVGQISSANQKSQVIAVDLKEWAG